MIAFPGDCSQTGELCVIYPLYLPACAGSFLNVFLITWYLPATRKWHVQSRKQRSQMIYTLFHCSSLTFSLITDHSSFHKPSWWERSDMLWLCTCLTIIANMSLISDCKHITSDTNWQNEQNLIIWYLENPHMNSNEYQRWRRGIVIIAIKLFIILLIAHLLSLNVSSASYQCPAG